MRDSRARPHVKLHLVIALGVAAFCILLTLRCRYELVLVVGSSMRPTLNPGNLLVIDKQAYRAREPAREDMILARYRGEFVIKRIMALPGEEVELKYGLLYINGSLRPENHPIEPGLLSIEKGKLFRGRFATLGDNRNVSQAQAVNPIVSKEDILGKVVALLNL